MFQVGIGVNSLSYSSLNCPICKSNNKYIFFEYFKKPKLETKFNINYKKYYRNYFFCKNCNHFFSNKNFFSKKFYEQNYSLSTYKKKIKKIFDKILKLSNKKSDNNQRVKRILRYKKKYQKINTTRLLDIGSGIGIFPFKMSKQKSWKVTSLEPDEESSKHIRKNLNIETINNEFLKANFKGRKFNFITLNKVIEHIESPLLFLKKAKKLITKNGVIYVEVPDGISASKLGKDREEFMIEHLHVFSKKSLSNLINKAGLKVKLIANILEPSGKFTIYAFIQV